MNCHLKRGFGVEFTAYDRRKNAESSANIISFMKHIAHSQ